MVVDTLESSPVRGKQPSGRLGIEETKDEGESTNKSDRTGWHARMIDRPKGICGLRSLKNDLGYMVGKCEMIVQHDFREGEPVDPSNLSERWWDRMSSGPCMPAGDNKLSRLTDIKPLAILTSS